MSLRSLGSSSSSARASRHTSPPARPPATAPASSPKSEGTRPEGSTTGETGADDSKEKQALMKSHPGLKFAEHVVKADDDLTDLAVRFGTSEAEIKRYNRRVVFDRLDNVLGDTIFIPMSMDLETFPDQRPLEQKAINVEAFALLAFQAKRQECCFRS